MLVSLANSPSEIAGRQRHLDWLEIWDFGLLEFLAKLKLPWNGTYWNPIAVNCTWMSDLCFELGNALREIVPFSNDFFSIITYNYHQNGQHQSFKWLPIPIFHIYSWDPPGLKFHKLTLAPRDKLHQWLQSHSRKCTRSWHIAWLLGDSLTRNQT